MPDRVALENVRFGYGRETLLDDVSMSLAPGSMLMVTGRSGCGKSTLIELCAGLLEPVGGQVLWNGENIWALSPLQRLSLRKRVGFVFQRHALISNLTVFDNVALPLRYHTDSTEWEIREQVGQRLWRCGIESLASKRPEQLSLDEARWVALARALAMEPELLFLDEPVEGVDTVTAHRIVHVINDTRRACHTTVLIASHRVRAVRAMRCPLAVIEDGRLSLLRHLSEVDTIPEPSGVSAARKGI